MNVKKLAALLLTGLLAASVCTFTGCGEAGSSQPAATIQLDPSHPVSLTVWHYYNGAQQAAFDELVSEFNATLGKENGIYVEGYSQGSVADLEAALTDSVEEKVGSQTMPDLFSTYTDTAYAIQKQDKLADLTRYFTQDELNEYVDSYIQEGYFHNDDALYLFPVAKSTEIMMMNKTEWDKFSKETYVTTADLATTEGIAEVAEKYYDWTDAQTPDIPDDGKAFYGRDSMSNYFILGMKQMGIDLFDVTDGQVTLRPEKEQLRRLWDDYYVPYVNGYFASAGKFRSDDVKTGEIIAYTGSASSSMYFPNEVIDENTSTPIDYMVLPAPVMKDGEQVQVQQGAGMAVTKSDAQHEYAACQFLRWFTEKENNLRFVCNSAYLPVRKDANSAEALDEVIADKNLTMNNKAYDCLHSILDNYNNLQFYTPTCFENGFATRKVLDYNLSDKAVADKAAIDAEVKKGKSRKDAVAPYVTDKAFDQWYDSFCAALESAAHPQ